MLSTAAEPVTRSPALNDHFNEPDEVQAYKWDPEPKYKLPLSSITGDDETEFKVGYFHFKPLLTGPSKGDCPLLLKY